MEDSFKKAYSGLNPEQKSAVDTIEGPVMVIAGPGTGKTSILTLRIANILARTDTPANGILALTFTESGVNAMRKKLVSYIGAQAYRIHIYTFHGFAQEIISKFPEYFPKVIGGSVASDSEKFALIEKEILEGEYDIVRPYGKPTLYVNKALRAISDLKRDGVSPSDFEVLLKSEEEKVLNAEDLKHEKGRFKGNVKSIYAETLRNNAKNKELARLYANYEKALREKNLYDYDDMLLELVRALKGNEDLLRTLQEEYLYILADEHQDANNSQNAVLELLSGFHDNPNLFIVGDEKQAIYRFQGASLENFLYFQKKFPEAVVIFLDKNYRSTQKILDASHALMSQNAPDPEMRPRLQSANKDEIREKAMSLVLYESEDDEREGVAEQIKTEIESGVPPEEIVVLVRTNAEVNHMSRALAGFNVPYTQFSDNNVLSDSDIAKLILLLRAVVYPENDEFLGAALFIDFLGLHPVDAVKINRFAKEKRLSPLEVISNGQLPEVSNPEALRVLSERFNKWMLHANNESALDSFLAIVAETKFQEYLLNKRESLEKVEKLAKLYDEIKVFLTSRKDATLKDFVVSLDTLLKHGGSISFSGRAFGTKGVSIMTAHKSKGLEWRQVYVVNVADRIWGKRRGVGGFHLPEPLGSGEDSERDEDERRLFYVALTRAKENVYLSYAKVDANGKDRLASQFVEELPKDLIEVTEGKTYSPSERLSRAQNEQELITRTVFDKKYLRDVFLDQGLNTTAFNNYIECPWKYFFKNLVRLPDAPEPYLHFGNAVHSALKALSDAKREGKRFEVHDFLAVFERDLARRPLSVSDLEKALEKGRKKLPIYFNARVDGWHENTLCEYDIADASIKLHSGEILTLRGRLDKLEILSGNEVNVVDYKTGRPKTRNEILGKTKSSDGNIKRQLDFYRLLLELHADGKYEMISGDVDFIEADEKGKLRKEHFEITHADAENLSQEILRVAKEIVNFEFWNKGCGEKDCEYCSLKTIVLESN
ncbi:MAG: hypothetical protein A2920_00015 [Candidatus Zambryskibacteria bacterium RIFCSPLOWO2_01_FULL_43_17]|uniref:DNA 3'-5' helicase n=1 Tax=Candidatus Zambryskibacteria bacterium RIFCSPLOWO2_01_FULL_43_17 TaxID=1802760 RepID=A0A1G2U5R2_9BACT|nr:MAG: hypothetical protein A2920_00015 [Candidatus Zambryskibacteria bacterium RIFCSPLOWO2_01_FULL_43_17]